MPFCVILCHSRPYGTMLSKVLKTQKKISGTFAPILAKKTFRGLWPPPSRPKRRLKTVKKDGWEFSSRKIGKRRLESGKDGWDVWKTLGNLDPPPRKFPNVFVDPPPQKKWVDTYVRFTHITDVFFDCSTLTARTAQRTCSTEKWHSYRLKP